MRIRHGVMITLTVLSLAGEAAPGFALAGDTPAADAAGAGAPDSETLEEVTVVAQKQNVDLQRAPVAISAITGVTLAQANITMPLDLNGQVPGLVITTSEGFNRSVSIRGIGFNVPQDDSAQASVSYHEDGIYVEYPVALNSGFLDVDHVEVLRGPQGTVFGQNSIGGTINVISKQPTFDSVNGYVEAAGGSRDLVHTSAAVNVPLADNFAIRGAFDQNYQHGYVTATDVPGYSGGYDLNDQNNIHGRLQALWQATTDLSILLRAEYDQAHEKEAEGKNIDDPDSDPWRESSDWPGRLVYNQQLAAATITYDFHVATLKALSSYQEVNQHGSVNEDGLNLDLQSALGNPHDVEWFLHNSKGITEELDLSSKPGGPVDWIVGAFYLKSRLTVGYDQYNVFAGDPTLNGSPNPDLLNANPDFTTTSPLITFLSTPGVLGAQLYFQNNGVEDRDSASAYGQATYHVTDDLRLTAGMRYTHDHNTTFFSDYYNQFGPPVSLEQTADKVTYRVAADYDLTKSNLLFASVSTGFKPGGGNISLAPAVVPYQFQPETLTAYEIGSKNSFLDKRLNVNLAGYFYQDKNMQFQAEDLINYQGGVDNIPHVDVYGLEGELAALLPANLRFDSNFAWEKGRITSHFLALDNDAGNAANQEFINLYGADAFYSIVGTGSPELNALRQAAYKDVYGNAPPSLPEWTATANLSHTLPFGDGSSLLSRVSVQYRADYADTIFGKTATYTAPSYVMTNVFFDYTLRSTGLDFSLAVNNLFDREAVLSRFTNQFGGETTQLFFPPREFTFKVHYQF
jgi:iron complex outermembrane receptor protein